MKKERALDLIVKLLKTASDKGATKNEAMIAALKAQELMAKYDIDPNEVHQEENTKAIVECATEVGTGHKWKLHLANIIANNFCCTVFCYDNGKIIVFYGYKKNAVVAREVFNFLFITGIRLANNWYMKEYNRGNHTKGVKNTFLLGYLDGIKSVLEKQCTALQLVVPNTVKLAYTEKMEKNSHHQINSTFKYRKDATNAYDEGVTQGRNVANARYLESSEEKV